MQNVELVSTKRPAVKPIADTRGQTFSYLQRRVHNALALATGDTIALAIALLLAGTLRIWWFGEPLIPTWSGYLLSVWWIGAGLMRLLPSWGLGPVEELRRITLLLLLFYAVTAVILFLSQQAVATSRLTLTIALVVSLFTVPLARLRVKRFLISFEAWGVPAVVYGAGETGERVVRFLQDEKGLGYTPVGVFDNNVRYWGKRLENVRVLGGIDHVAPQAPVAILAMPGLSRERLVELIEGPLSHYRKILLIPDLLEVPSLWVRPRDLNGMLGLEITSNLMSPLARFVKRTADVFLATLLVVLLTPLCVTVALLIWMEDQQHPLFAQKRIGVDGRTFKVWKFRTMVPKAEDVLRRKLDEDDALRREWDTHHKLKDDPRVTRIGRILRRYSLDELPQLINVLRGDMSLVGPRPLPFYHHDDLPPRVRDLRERVRPGITGLWQVSGRSDAGTEGMKQHDPYYVRNWSLWLDIVVLVRTFRTVIKGAGAY